jgi:CheY-like chemotaxis protein
MKQILIIDDSNLARASVKRILEPEGYEILAATGGEEGMKMFAKNRPDLILVDLMMPGVSGMDVLEQLKAAGSTTPVIVITADMQEGVNEKCFELGAYAVINKPLLFETLAVKVKEALS